MCIDDLAQDRIMSHPGETVGGNLIQERDFSEAFFPASLWNQEVSKAQGWLSCPDGSLSPEPSSSMPSHPTTPVLLPPLDSPWLGSIHHPTTNSGPPPGSSHSPEAVGTVSWGLEDETGQPCSPSLSLSVYK